MLFIPMYNCEKQISRVVDSLTPELQKLFCEVVVIDNGSTDNSHAVASQSLGKLTECPGTLLQNNQNISLGGSHKVAFNRCLEKNYDSVVVLHGDDQGRIIDLTRHFGSSDSLGEAFQYDNFLGARFAKGSQREGYHWFRTFGNLVFNVFTTLITGKAVYDMGSGLNMYSKEYLQDRFYLTFPNDLTFNTYMLLHAIYSKSKIKFFPLLWREDDQISNAKIFRQAWANFKKIIASRFNKKSILSPKENSVSRLDYTSRVIFES